MHYDDEKLGKIGEEDPDRHQSLSNCSLSHAPPSPPPPKKKRPPKSVRNFLRYNSSHRQTRRQTDTEGYENNNSLAEVMKILRPFQLAVFERDIRINT